MMRGLGEGQYAWDLDPESLMTNATVTAVTGAPRSNPEGHRVKRGGGETLGFVIEAAPPLPSCTRDTNETTTIKVSA
jgi:hypothetical protein